MVFSGNGKEWKVNNSESFKFLKKEEYVKSSFVYERDKVTQCETWTVIEDQIDSDSDKVFKDIYEQMVIFIHPMFSTAASDDTKTSEAKKAASAITVDSSCTRPPDEISTTPAVKAAAVAEISKDASPNEEQVE